MTASVTPPTTAPEVRMCVDPRYPFYGRVAIKTATSVTAGEWFIFDQASGGGYTDGSAAGVDTEAWQPMTKPADVGEQEPVQ